ncbi:hypothetical protein ACFZBM_30855 [Streptomyces lavendulae]|uniref:hypothetical protein n=1 Tax=Streptomyces lavendulae TaxID=1914 RepID=UPI0036E0D311
MNELQAAALSHPADNFAMRMIEPVRVLRHWAIAHQPEFNLLFGTPATAAGDAHRKLTSSWVRRLAGLWGLVFAQLWADRPFPVLAEDEMDPRPRQQMLDYRADTGVDLPAARWWAAGGRSTARSRWRSSGTSPLVFSDQEPMFELLMRELVRGAGLEGPDSL